MPALFLCLASVTGSRLAAAENGKAGIEVTVVTLEGEEQRQTLLGLSPTEIQCERGGVPLKDVSAIVFAPPGPPAAGATTLHLRNGDVLNNVTLVSGDESKLALKGETWGSLKIEYKFLHAISFAGKERPRADVIEAFLKAAPPKEDQILTAKGETISGYLERFTEKDMSFNAGGQSRAYAFDQLAAFRLAPLEEYKPRTELLGSIELRGGSRVTGKLLALHDGKLKIEALNGQPWDIPVDALSSIAFKGGKLVYLGELKPAAVEEKPYVGGMPVVYRWRRDRAVTGGTLTIAGKTYEKGLGVHSFARLEFDLGGQYAKFLCDVGPDLSAGANSSCAWKVLLDGKEAAAGAAKAGGKAEPLRLDVTGVQRLALVCDYGPDDNDAGDHLDWAGARLLKP